MDGRQLSIPGLITTSLVLQQAPLDAALESVVLTHDEPIL